MHVGRAGFIAVLLLAAAARGQEGVTLEELQRRNEALEERVRSLEKGRLETEVESYLAEQHAAAQGAEGLHPGALALRISGELRIREEVQDHVYRPQDPDAVESFEFAHMRTRLRFDVDVLENLGVVIEFQDVRILGEEGSTTADAEGVDLKRAYIDFRRVGGRSVDVEAGRFVMQYGDHRHIGHLEWFDQGRTYDGLRVLCAPDPLWVDFFAVRVRETIQPGGVIAPDDDQWLLGLYGGSKSLEGYALLFGDDMAAAGETGVDDTTFVTLGARVHGKPGSWDYTGEASFQVGGVRGDDLSAFAFAAMGGYTFADAAWRPRIGLEVDYATGDDDPADGDNGQFQTLFPTNHLHYGFLDLVGWSNILDLRASLALQPSEKWKVTLDVHHFRRPESAGAWVNAGGAVIRGGLAGSDRHLGDEVDLTVTWKPSAPLSFLFGYSIFVPGGFVEDTGDDPLSHFLYLETRVIF